MSAARIVIAQSREIHMIQDVDTAWHQLDRLCPCGPDIYPFGGVYALWVRMDHLHYGPEEEFEHE